MNYSTRDKYCLIILFFLSIVFVFFITFPNTIYAQQPQQQNEPQSIAGINLLDSNLKLELVTSGLDFPTTMAFLAPDDFLILEKSGTVKRVTDDQIVDKPLLHVDVNEKDERGLLGIAVNDMKGINGTSTDTDTDTVRNVFLYYIICEGKNADCKNQIYTYNLDNKNNALINPKLLLSIPSFPDPAHI
ncbi:MAG: PQQ-dependent sugar dehydrogenase, partial [Nitrososphaeraceae archaeon]